MRFVLPIALVACLLLPAASVARSPHLTVATVSPLTVKGLGFAGRERIRVSLSLSDSAPHWTTTTATGGFTVRFSVHVTACTAYVVRASGLRGDAAILRVRPPECPQPLTP